MSLLQLTLIRGWLQAKIYPWAKFQIQGAARYLGVALGSAAAQIQWSIAFDKWSWRASLIASIGAPASMSARLYNVRAVTTLSYIAQLRPLPYSASSLERKLLGRMLRTRATCLDTKSS